MQTDTELQQLIQTLTPSQLLKVTEYVGQELARNFSVPVAVAELQSRALDLQGSSSDR